MMLMVAVGAMVGQAGAESPLAVPVSNGLRVLAAQNEMGVCGVSGSEIAFSPADFERALNSRRVDCVTFTSLPDPSLGSLRLGSDGISVGQTVSRENIHKLCYVPSGEGISENSFTFTTGMGYELECAVYILDQVNYSPTAGVTGELSLAVSTHRNVTVFGSLSGHDADGDEIRFEIVSYPVNGYLTVTDQQNGEFRYTPVSDFVGKDSFKYVVVDEYGNYSAASEVSMEVKKVSLDSVLVDMGGNRAHTAAITMVEKGLMSVGTNEKGESVFSPSASVTREEFLVAAMKAVGISDPGGSTPGFEDDADISASARGYVALAREKGYISGGEQSGKLYFYPDKTVTVAEASVIIDNIIGGARYVVNDKSALSVFEDHDDIPTFAKESMQILKRVGIISGNSGYLYPESGMTKENASMMLGAVIRLIDRGIK